MAWLAGQFGLDRLRRAEVVLPDATYFPEAYHGTETDARRLFDRLCGFLKVERSSITLEFFEADDPADAARLASGTVVRSQGAAGFWIENGQLAFPVTEVNISGRFGAMLAGVDAVGRDLTWFGSIGVPTIRVQQMTISGL